MKALFLDRDGVINLNHGYVYQREMFDFIPGIFDLTKHAQKKGYQIFVVTNQSGIARQYYSQNEFRTLTHWMKHEFSQRGILIKAVSYCPHHPKHHFGGRTFCLCRKPKPQLITRLARSHRISLSRSLMIGDSLSDIRAAKSAGIGTQVLLTHGMSLTKPQLEAPVKKPYYRAQNLHAIKDLL